MCGYLWAKRKAGMFFPPKCLRLVGAENFDVAKIFATPHHPTPFAQRQILYCGELLQLFSGEEGLHLNKINGAHQLPGGSPHFVFDCGFHLWKPLYYIIETYCVHKSSFWIGHFGDYYTIIRPHNNRWFILKF